MDSYRKAAPRKKASSQRGTVKESFRSKEEQKAFRNKEEQESFRSKERQESLQRKKGKQLCPAAARCGGCDLQGVEYKAQLSQKDRQLKKLLGGLAAQLHPIVGMDDPAHYRCKVNAAFGLDRKGRPVLGRYEKNSHSIVQASSCMIEDEKADEIARTIFSLLRSFRIRVYDEDSGFGFLRHVQIRRAFVTGQYMVTLVCTDPVFPSRQNFVKVLRGYHSEISTIILNINDRRTSMVLGERNITLYGKGFIEDELCGYTFRISPGSFYQVNPPQAQRLYETALRYADLTGQEHVLDAYCGTGTIGIIASGCAKQVTGVELNAEAVRDAVWNARRNKVENIRFVKMDATDYMDRLSSGIDKSGTPDPDVLILDPPRSGTTLRFIEAAARMAPERIVYVSCSPDTLARDLKLFCARGYRVREVQGFDLFPFTSHTEVVALMTREKG